MMRHLSVSELAQACAPVNTDGEFDANRLRLWIRRLRHWTVLGILPASSRNGEGAGKHRLYRPELAYQAAVLLRVAGAGLPFPIIKLIADDLLKDTVKDGRLSSFWSDATMDSKSQSEYLLAIWIAEEGEFVWMEGATADSGVVNLKKIDMLDAPTILLNLSNIFGRMNEFAP